MPDCFISSNKPSLTNTKPILKPSSLFLSSLIPLLPKMATQLSFFEAFLGIFFALTPLLLPVVRASARTFMRSQMAFRSLLVQLNYLVPTWWIAVTATEHSPAVHCPARLRQTLLSLCPSKCTKSLLSFQHLSISVWSGKSILGSKRPSEDYAWKTKTMISRSLVPTSV